MIAIRPEIRAAFLRWRELLAGLVLLLLGAWWIYGQAGLMLYVGGAVAALGMALIVAGWQRGRFRRPALAAQGPGTVDVDEGQITYFGPLTGGAVALRDLRELALIRAGQSPHWRLRTGAETLLIPVDAAGADDLFDAFSALPGLKTERMLSVLQDQKAHDTVIWQTPDIGPGPSRLH